MLSDLWTRRDPFLDADADVPPPDVLRRLEVPELVIGPAGMIDFSDDPPVCG